MFEKRLFVELSAEIHNRVQSVQNKRTHQEISEILWFIEPTKLLVVVYHFNRSWSLDFECCLSKASMMHRRKIGNQLAVDMLKLSTLWMFKMEVESPMQFRWRKTRTEYRARFNDWKNQLDTQIHKRVNIMSACSVYFLHKFKTRDPKLTYVYTSKDSLLLPPLCSPQDIHQYFSCAPEELLTLCKPKVVEYQKAHGATLMNTIHMYYKTYYVLDRLGEILPIKYT